MNGDGYVFVVDDDEAVRTSLQWLLESAGLHVRTFAAGPPLLEELAAMNDTPWGCVLVDLRLPGMSGLELQERLNGLSLDLPVIMITGHGDVPVAVRAMKAGALDFIEKPFNDQRLLERVQEAMASGASHRRTTTDRTDLQRRAERLSPRERQVMDMVVGGWLNKQIASELGLSHKTVEVHRAHVMEKMQAASLAELVRMAVALEHNAGVASAPDSPTRRSEGT